MKFVYNSCKKKEKSLYLGTFLMFGGGEGNEIHGFYQFLFFCILPIYSQKTSFFAFCGLLVFLRFSENSCMIRVRNWVKILFDLV